MKERELVLKQDALASQRCAGNFVKDFQSVPSLVGSVNVDSQADSLTEPLVPFTGSVRASAALSPVPQLAAAPPPVPVPRRVVLGPPFCLLVIAGVVLVPPSRS